MEVIICYTNQPALSKIINDTVYDKKYNILAVDTNKLFNGEFRGIKLFPQEEVLDIQRQHLIALLIPLSAVVLLIVVVIGILMVLFRYFGYIEDPLISITAILVMMVAFTFLLALSTYIFLHWFFMFYIITNKRLMHVHFFRIGGFHLDEVLHERTDPLEIDREPKNFFLDFLGIEDIYVYFHRFERPEPFIFETPENSNRIEELLEEHLLTPKDRNNK